MPFSRSFYSFSEETVAKITAVYSFEPTDAFLESEMPYCDLLFASA